MTNHAKARCGWLSTHPPTKQPPVPLARLFFFQNCALFLDFSCMLHHHHIAASPPHRLAVLLSIVEFHAISLHVSCSALSTVKDKCLLIRAIIQYKMDFTILDLRNREK